MAGQDKKKRILFVDRNYYPDRDPEDFPSRDELHPSIKAFYSIADGLEEKCVVERCFDLDPRIAVVIQRRKGTEQEYDALITHVPFSSALPAGSVREGYEARYGNSLIILGGIKKDTPLMPIIAYTGAARLDEVVALFKRRGIDEVVFKSREWQKDLVEIKTALNRLCGAGFKL